MSLSRLLIYSAMLPNFSYLFLHMSTTILTGASKGIGKAIAEIYLDASPNNNLVAVARDQQALEALKEKYGKRVAIVAGDVSKASTSTKAVETAINEFGRLDSIIANAGVLLPVNEHVEKVDIDEWRNLFEINYFAIVSLVQAAIPHLRKSKGKVVVVSLGALTKAYSGWFAYGSSKAAINLFVQYLDESEEDVQAISVAPGVVDTGMQTSIREEFGSSMSAEGLKRFQDLMKNKQLLSPEIPALVFVNLALKGWPSELNGKYVRYNDEQLANYQ